MDGLYIGRAENDGASVVSARLDGVYVGSAGLAGMRIYSAAQEGLNVQYAGQDGVYVLDAGWAGMRVYSATLNGVHVESAGADGVFVSDAVDDGVTVVSAGNRGLAVNHADGDGLYVCSTGDRSGCVPSTDYHHGLEVGSAQHDGVHVISAGNHGVYASGESGFGFWTPDAIFAGGGLVDIAEHIDTTGEVEPGDVVVIDSAHDERVAKSTKPYDTAVAGIISTDPAMVIGKSDTETPLALAGRVLCKVSAENGPIRRGDLLTTSSTPGHAMKATEPKLGTILGKAMGELESGTGFITVLVTLQ
jgi:hypothetical protein